MDRNRNPEGAASFWRCSHCGARFMGPLVLGRKRRHRRTRARDRLIESLTLSRVVKRWVFPAIVILCTILAVMYVLDRRDPRPEQMSSPKD